MASSIGSNKIENHFEHDLCGRKMTSQQRSRLSSDDWQIQLPAMITLQHFAELLIVSIEISNRYLKDCLL